MGGNKSLGANSRGSRDKIGIEVEMRIRSYRGVSLLFPETGAVMYDSERQI